jgi:hypothetical protein
MAKLNLITKPVKGSEYILPYQDMMLTNLSKSKFEKVKEWNPEKFDGCEFVPFKEIDWLYIERITKYLTMRGVYSNQAFDYTKDISSGKVLDITRY